MTFAREKRRLLGWLALLAPVPLPFNEVVGWPSVFMFWAGVGVFIYLNEQGVDRWLPVWAMNVLAVLYLPLMFFDLSVLWRGRLLQPLVHLVMYVLVVKLFALHGEKDKWHAVFALFFLFLAAIGTSVHPTVVLYLLLFFVLSIFLLGRFAGFHIHEKHGVGSLRRMPVPLGGFVWGGTVLAVLVAIPIFAVFPRLGSPYLFGEGAGLHSVVQMAGFSDRMSLDRTGRIKTNRDVAMRLQFEESPPRESDFRLKAATYDLFRDNEWVRGRRPLRTVTRQSDGMFHLRSDQPVAWVTMWLEPLGTANLPLPSRRTTLDVALSSLEVDESGVVWMMAPYVGTLRFRVGLAARSDDFVALGSDAAHPDAEYLDQDSITDRIRGLAVDVARQDVPSEQAWRLESYLSQEFEYTLDLVGMGGEQAIEDFLFRHRRGHCEYFASAMVLMLRSLDIPARVVTGFYGAEFNPLEQYFIVRQSNAHAWVEAYLTDLGEWRTFDPTPPGGRPAASRSGWRSLLAQGWDFVVFRWDRYVLTYGLYDQIRAVFGLRDIWKRLFGGRGDPESMDTGTDEETPGIPNEISPEDEIWRPDLGVEGWGVLLISVALAALWIWRRRPVFNATYAYRQLRARARRLDPKIGIGVAPEALRLWVSSRYPATADSARSVVLYYLGESFGGRPLGERDLKALKESYRHTMRGVRKLD